MVAAVCPALVDLPHRVHTMLAPTVFVLLVAYVLVVHGRNGVRGRPSQDARAQAWSRARAVDAADGWLEALVAAAVPAIVAASLVALSLPHLADDARSPAAQRRPPRPPAIPLRAGTAWAVRPCSPGGVAS